MAREIKFRAWNGRAMEYGGFNVHATGRIEPTMGLTQVREKSPLMQYTGLKDKNGMDIYEGDIVEHHRAISAPCDYHSGEPSFLECEYIRIGHITITASKGVTLNGKQETRDYNEDKHISSRKYNENPRCWDEFAEVIGNIYENHELLEGK